MFGGKIHPGTPDYQRHHVDGVAVVCIVLLLVIGAQTRCCSSRRSR
jgi:hypothetical protein